MPLPVSQWGGPRLRRCMGELSLRAEQSKDSNISLTPGPRLFCAPLAPSRVWPQDHSLSKEVTLASSLQWSHDDCCPAGGVRLETQLLRAAVPSLWFGGGYSNSQEKNTPMGVCPDSNGPPVTPSQRPLPFRVNLELTLIHIYIFSKGNHLQIFTPCSL